METILVTGANGFIGSRVAAALASSARVTGTYLHNLGVRVTGTSYVRCDLTRRDEVHRMLDRVRPDAIVHIAGTKDMTRCQQSPSFARRSHVAATENLLAGRRGSRFIYLSTDCVFDGTKERFAEEDPRRAINAYGAAKLECEELIDAILGSDAAICRASLVYGWPFPGQSSNTVMDVVRAARRRWPLRFPSTLFNTPVFVDDLAHALARVATSNATGTFHFAGRERVSRYELACRTAAAFAIRDPIVPLHVDSGIRPKNSCLAIDATAARLHWQPRTLEDGLRAMREELEDPRIRTAVGASLFADGRRVL